MKLVYVFKRIKLEKNEYKLYNYVQDIIKMNYDYLELLRKLSLLK